MGNPQLHEEGEFRNRIQYDPTSGYYSEPPYPILIFIH